MCCAGGASLLPPACAETIDVTELARCATIGPDPQRLACFDHLTRHVPTADPASPVQAPAAAQSFGMVKPPADKPPEQSRLEAKVSGITTDSRGTSLVQLDNEQSWTVDDGPVMLKAGDAIVIKRATLGSFLMTTPTHRVYRVRRLR